MFSWDRVSPIEVLDNCLKLRSLYKTTVCSKVHYPKESSILSEI